MHRELTLAAAFVVAAQAALVGAMLMGSVLADPGGVAGVAMVVGPVLLTVALAALAWWRPQFGVFVAIGVGFGAVLISFVNAWATGLPEWFGGYANVVPVAAFVVIAAFGLRRPTVGGALLLAVAALVAMASPGIALFLAGPAALAAVLFVIAGRMTAGHHAAAPLGRTA